MLGRRGQMCVRGGQILGRTEHMYAREDRRWLEGQLLVRRDRC